MITAAASPSTIKLSGYQTEAIKAVNDADMFRIIKPFAVFVNDTFNAVVLALLAPLLVPALKSWRMWTALHEVKSG
jgi:hypothetical protein